MCVCVCAVGGERERAGAAAGVDRQVGNMSPVCVCCTGSRKKKKKTDDLPRSAVLVCRVGEGEQDEMCSAASEQT